MKTNKSFTKRIKITRNGKLLARKAGGNHFNAKESRVAQLARRGKTPLPIPMNNKAKGRFLPGIPKS